MEEAYKGRDRAIGVSNFSPNRFIDLQCLWRSSQYQSDEETHVFLSTKRSQKYLEKYNCQIRSWGPFAEGKNDFFNTPLLKERLEKIWQIRSPSSPTFLTPK